MFLSTRSTIIVLSLITSPCTYAANWQMLGGEYTFSDTAPPTKLYAGVPFTDGVSTSIRNFSIPGEFFQQFGGDWILRDSSDPATSTLLFMFAGKTFDSLAPPVEVKLTREYNQINVGGMWQLSAQTSANDGSSIFGGWLYGVGIGYALTPVYDVYTEDRNGVKSYSYSTYDDWAAVTVNGDGTYTATWRTLGSGNFLPQYEGEFLPRMSITFQAAAVPEPGQTVLFGLGLLGIAARVRSLRGSANPV